MLELIKGLVKRGVSNKEVANVKTQMKGKYEMGLENAENQVSHNGKELLLYDNTHITPYKYMYDTYAGITREDINRVIAKYFKLENMNIAMVGGKLPKSESIQRLSMRVFE
jgi:predicted Zn-dependent peptidase